MNNLLLGHAPKGAPVYLPRSSFDTHWHLIGGTGKGKTTAIHTILHGLMKDPIRKPCVVIIDRMGGLSTDLLRWMASSYCPAFVRERLVYIEPARDNVVIGFNPLLYDTEGHAFFKVSRASEIILRGWASQDLQQMPRLARWLFNCFYACALMGLTVADCIHLLLPKTDLHKRLMNCLPDLLRSEWSELTSTSPTEISRILDSTRNRLHPFFNSPNLRAMFGSSRSSLDMLRFMREGKIVVLNLNPANRIPEDISDAIGGLVLNEVLSVARSLPLGIRYPTYLVLDEFQRFVGPDIEMAIPEVRQLGIKMILSHQSFSQLKRGDLDLTSMIFQAQSRMVFGVQGEDADILAHELASFTFNPHKIKDELYSRKQRISGHRIIDLQSESYTTSQSQNWTNTYGKNWARGENVTHARIADIKSDGNTWTDTNSKGEGRGNSDGQTRGTSQHLLPVYEEYLELMNRTYVSFEEDRNCWGRDIRRLTRGDCFLRIVDDPNLYTVSVKRSAPGYLGWDTEKLMRHMPSANDKMQELIERNFESDLFVSPSVIEREARERLDRVLGGAVVQRSPQTEKLESHGFL
jgi:hypothetical protein